MTVKDVQGHFTHLIKDLYDETEATAIASIVAEYVTGLSKAARLMHANHHLSNEDLQAIERISAQISQAVPVQYIIGESYFFNKAFKVNEAVLIPRPETEELVDWILEDYPTFTGSITDIGTGSGCIAVSLACALPQAQVSAVDISKEALTVAKQNSIRYTADVQFFEVDILKAKDWGAIQKPDIIVSNPPYIPHRDKATMHKNVLGHEPHTALFVPDDDALIFYEKIADLALVANKPVIYFEIHEQMAEAVCNMLLQKGYQNRIVRKDIFGKDRMVKATR